jgi:aspartate dehydrogenase
MISVVVSKEAAAMESAIRYMTTQRLRVGIAGVGTIGTAVIRRLDAEDVGADVVAAAARDIDAARARLGPLRRVPAFVSLAELADRCDVVVECLPSALFDAVAQPAVERGRTFVPLSVGALLERPELIERARATGARIVVPTGALLGLDAVRAAAEGPIARVAIVTRKPPTSLGMHDVKEPVRVFAGSARDGAKRFPANVNVAAALSLAGVGPDRTALEIWADPALTRNTHHIEVEADATRFTMTIESVPYEDHPATGKLTPLSVIATLRGMTSVLKVGT